MNISVRGTSVTCVTWPKHTPNHPHPDVTLKSVRTKTSYYRRLYVDLPDPIVFMILGGNTSRRSCIKISLLFPKITHSSWVWFFVQRIVVPEESGKIVFFTQPVWLTLRDLSWHIGLILGKSLVPKCNEGLYSPRPIHVTLHSTSSFHSFSWPQARPSLFFP